MTTDEAIIAAPAALDDAEAALATLDAACCEPGRSPRMRALANTMIAARTGIDRAASEPGAAGAALQQLEDAGAQVGRLQVGCCAPDRLPLYARMLEDFTTTQLSLNRVLGTGH